MDWLDKLRQAAKRVAEQATEGAERGARYIAEHGPGFIGAGAGELLAERDYHRAAALWAEASPAAARQVIATLAAHRELDCRHAVLIHRLLGLAHAELGELPEARAELSEALRLLRDPAERLHLDAVLVEETGAIGDEMEAELLVALASIELDQGDYDACIRHAMQAVEEDRRCLEAYRLQGLAMLRKGIDSPAVAEVFMKAMMNSDAPETVLAWVREYLPEHLEWFERAAR